MRRVDLTSTADPSIPRVSGVVADIMKSPKVAELDRLKKEQQQRRRARDTKDSHRQQWTYVIVRVLWLRSLASVGSASARAMRVS